MGWEGSGGGSKGRSLVVRREQGGKKGGNWEERRH